MKSCKDCKHAKWDRREGGNLHPGGGGKCQYHYVVPALPSSMYWIHGTPQPSGGDINRREELKEHCVYWARA